MVFHKGHAINWQQSVVLKEKAVVNQAAYDRTAGLDYVQILHHLAGLLSG